MDVRELDVVGALTLAILLPPLLVFGVFIDSIYKNLQGQLRMSII
jgi:hypothetical protein